METKEKTVLTVEAIVNAPLAAVWEKWTKPEDITKWNFASDDWQCPNATNDLRVGGNFSARMPPRYQTIGRICGPRWQYAGDYR